MPLFLIVFIIINILLTHWFIIKGFIRGIELKLALLFKMATDLTAVKWFILCFVWQFIMNTLTPEQRLQIVQFYFENNGSVRNTFYFFLAMKRTSGWMATSTNKTAAFGVKLILKCMSKHRYIQKKKQDPYFFKTDNGQNVQVNGDRYRAMITNFFITELNNQYV